MPSIGTVNLEIGYWKFGFSEEKSDDVESIDRVLKVLCYIILFNQSILR